MTNTSLENKIKLGKTLNEYLESETESVETESLNTLKDELGKTKSGETKI
jgi:hypothetical protein